MTRTVVRGRASDALRRQFEAVRDAQRAAGEHHDDARDTEEAGEEGHGGRGGADDRDRRGR
jgi:hypothetical protein